MRKYLLELGIAVLSAFVTVILWTIFIVGTSCLHAAEPVFLLPAAHDTLIAQDSVSVSLNAPRQAPGMHKYWSLAVAVNPYSAQELVWPIVDTLAFPVDSALPFTARIRLPIPRPGDTSVCLILIFHPSLVEYRSPAYAFRVKPKDPPTALRAVTQKSQYHTRSPFTFTLTGRLLK